MREIGREEIEIKKWGGESEERENGVNKIIVFFFFIQHVNSEVAYMQPHCSGVGK